MIFLIEYARHQGRVVTFKAFDEAARRQAEDERLEMELDLNRRGIVHEVVLFEAATEAALRRTHRRYFEDLADLAKLPAS
ncbi:MAG: hypothetical protein HOP18_14960 [Deltaproteobacteria bacterium]|nr:hypothetical protein [Deltaproteobacteria bacterium]